MQKGQTGILILAGIVLVIALVGGAYYLGTKHLTNPTPLSKPTNTSFLGPTPIYHNFQDTTKGVEISLPDNLIACEYATSDVKLVQAQTCNYIMDDGSPIGVDTYNQFHHPMFGPVTPKTNQQSLHDWVTEIANRDSANNDELNKTGPVIREQSDDISDIDSNTVLDEITDKLTESNKVSYSYRSIIYQQQGDNIIALSLASNTKGENVDKLKSLLPLIRTIPITTGDLRLNITWHHNRNSGVYADYTGYLYQNDQKTIAANIKTDSDGYYFVKLKPGTYYFFYPDGSSKQLQVKLGVNNFVPFTNNNVIDIATEKDMFNGPVPNSPPQ